MCKSAHPFLLHSFFNLLGLCNVLFCFTTAIENFINFGFLESHQVDIGQQQREVKIAVVNRMCLKELLFSRNGGARAKFYMLTFAFAFTFVSKFARCLLAICHRFWCQCLLHYFCLFITFLSRNEDMNYCFLMNHKKAMHFISIKCSGKCSAYWTILLLCCCRCCWGSLALNHRAWFY